MKLNGPRLLLLTTIAALAIAFFVLDLHHILTLAELKARQQVFATYYAGHRAATLALYFFLYVAVTALSLPGAAVLTLAGGALLGFWPALVSISFASTLGATLAFLSSRFLLHDWIQQRYGDKLKTVNNGIARDGAFYLFTLRLVPIFPFFIINLLLGLTPLRTRTFTWVSQLGMLPGTAVYVNAGTQLGRIESLADIFSPGLILAFALLGLFPLAAKKVAAVLARGK